MKNRTRSESLRIYRKILNKVRYALVNWDFGDINRAAHGGAKLGVFILGSCYIDHLACLYSGRDSSENIYVTFVNRFLPQYTGRDLYKSMRCKLVHNYTEGGKYSFIHNRYDLHLKFINNTTLINLRSFINDLKKARDNYFKEVKNNDDLKINLVKRYINYGLMGPVEI